MAVKKHTQATQFNYSIIAAGILFAILWSSAAAATKIGLQSAQPFVVAIPRFFIAAIIMLLIAHIVLRKRLPAGKEWKQLAVYGLLNISIYLGLYVIAMQHVSAGLGSLSVAINPILISIMAGIWLHHPVKRVAVISLLLCCSGIFIAAMPLFESSYATPGGLSILFISTISYSAGAVYFSKQQWNNLHILALNGWQTLFGGIFLLPVAAITYQPAKNNFDCKWLGSVLWLAIAVSLFAVQLWLYLLRKDPVKASFWLFLCPVSGFIIAAVMLHEPVSLYTVAGVALVIAGLYLVQKKKPGTA
ncbi:DMT family transporter [Parafilimonas sp.]|uniref:DMT family transporter n=1 Tax=Parafilimonas sp. TaxID=1969739 RepID=UPI0039E3C244